MKIQYCSDLHLEFPHNFEFIKKNPIIPTGDILVLAGDILPFQLIDKQVEFLNYLADNFEKTYWIPGNHEYYMVQNTQPLSMSKLLDRLFTIEKKIHNLYILNQSSVIIGDICISGCTLWSKATVNIPKFIVRIHGMNNEIYDNKFKNDLNYINKMIDYCNTNKLKLIVVTHYCPTYKIVDQNRKKDKYISLYVTELDNLLYKQKVNTWFCGHIHRNFNIITEGGTKVIGNQKGKPKDKIIDYKKDFIVKLE